MSADARAIEEPDDVDHADLMMTVASQQSKLARDQSREKIRRIVAIVSVALTLLAVLLVTAFLALGSKLEKQWRLHSACEADSDRNANQRNSGGSPFAEDTQESISTPTASPPPMKVAMQNAELTRKRDGNREGFIFYGTR